MCMPLVTLLLQQLQDLTRIDAENAELLKRCEAGILHCM
jgi:hypothetical protein